jgi:hypothetical protein
VVCDWVAAPMGALNLCGVNLDLAGNCNGERAFAGQLLLAQSRLTRIHGTRLMPKQPHDDARGAPHSDLNTGQGFSPCTLWCRHDRGNGPVYNHLEDGHATTAKPSARVAAQAGWARSEWSKCHGWLTTDAPPKVTRTPGSLA